MSILTVYTTAPISRDDDGVFSISLAPPEPIGGWTLQTQVSKRFGGTPFITRNLASGFIGTSGMNIINSGQGQFSFNINSVDFSGYDYGAYAFQVLRTDPGSHTNICEGYLLIGP